MSMNMRYVALQTHMQMFPMLLPCLNTAQKIYFLFQ